jgi:hypothetical protein
MQPPNKALELTPRGGERDRVDFDGWKRLDCIPDLQGGAAQRQGVGRAIDGRQSKAESSRSHTYASRQWKCSLGASEVAPWRLEHARRGERICTDAIGMSISKPSSSCRGDWNATSEAVDDAPWRLECHLRGGRRRALALEMP